MRNANITKTLSLYNYPQLRKAVVLKTNNTAIFIRSLRRYTGRLVAVVYRYLSVL
ncbi:hypothetical protein [Fervidobacterium gondwanense]|uniref:hypothetical protein n=1 Tax=Fervidobacterium gondwanense TaxID=44754 RepID=UPI0015BDBF91|nr:hypothetical protein [Fervidobacterium gondwanense]